ncbi:hypothetical protein BJX62DRAFT_244483 [Aspergillus germanicus]
MKISRLIITSLAIAVNSTTALKVFTGEQINYGVNYVVVWKDSEGPCNSNQLLAPVSENACDTGFWIDSAYYHLGCCGTDDFGLYKADGSRVGPCTRVKDTKYQCSSSDHDVIKHWSCGN